MPLFLVRYSNLQNSVISNEMVVDALKYSEFLWLRRLAFFSLLRKLEWTGGYEVGGSQNQGPFK